MTTALALVSLLLALSPGRAEAAPPPGAGRQKATPHLLDEAVARGEITRAKADEHLVDVFTGRGRSGKVPAKFQSDEPWDGTLPLLRLKQRLEAQPPSAVKARGEAALAAATRCDDSTAALPNETWSDHFYLAYGTINGGLTAASYLTSLETAYAKEVATFGWAAPPAKVVAAPVGTRYVVRVDALVGGLYGFVSTSSVSTGAGFVGDNPNTTWNDQDAEASCMVLSNDFSQFRGTAQQALDATTAHEYNHSIQFGYGAFSGFNAADNVMAEAGATWMEDEVFDSSNDNYGYLWPNFRDSLGDYDQLEDGSPDPYPMWIVLRGLTERFGTGTAGGGEQVMQDFWENTSKGIGNNLSALDIALSARGTTLRDAYHDFAIGAGFMRACGGAYTAPNCFEEAAAYTTLKGLPPVAGSISAAGGSFSSTIEDDYSLAWVTLPASGAYSLTLSNQDPSGGELRATAVCDTGSGLFKAPFPAVAGPNQSTKLDTFNATGCVRSLAVITNQQQSPGDPFNSPSRAFRLSAGIAGPNVAPVANNDSYTTIEGAPLTIPAPGVLANDTDANGNPLTATLPSGQTGGSVSLNPNGSFTFTPTPGFTGTAGFGYTANDGNGGTDPATVSITVKPRPTYVPLTPARLLDTRPTGVTIDGLSQRAGAIGPGSTRSLQVTGRGGVPTTPVGAVALNITVTGPTAGGFVTVFPAGETRPVASNLNFTAGQTIPNLVIAKVGAGGQVSLYNESGSTHLIADVAGWFPTGQDYTALSPARLLDTRPTGLTVDGISQREGAVGPRSSRSLQVTGRGSVPATGVGAVVLNVTVTGPTAGSFATVYPTGEALPVASNLNFAAGETIPNLVIAKVGAGGQVSIYNESGSTHLIADVAGWFPTGSDYTALSPARLLDTRTGGTTIDGVSAGSGAVGPGATRVLQVTGRGGVPPSGVGAVVLNITATGPTVGGFVTVFPTGEARPVASNLNFTAGQTIPNLVIAKVGPGGQVSLYNESGSTHLIADVAGWLPAV